MYTEAKIVLWVLKRETMKRINSENMKILQITNEDYESYLNQANCHICKKKALEDEYIIFKIHCKFRDHCHYAGQYLGALHNINNLKCSIPQKIPVFVS